MGIELIRGSIHNAHKTVYKPTQTSHPSWNQRVGKHTENLKWLL
jgi:hypothetical protein